jgi:hypothetical protein
MSDETSDQSLDCLSDRSNEGTSFLQQANSYPFLITSHLPSLYHLTISITVYSAREMHISTRRPIHNPCLSEGRKLAMAWHRVVVPARRAITKAGGPLRQPCVIVDIVYRVILFPFHSSLHLIHSILHLIYDKACTQRLFHIHSRLPSNYTAWDT